MSLPAPNLDDRDFQSLVDDAKRMVQERCPEWTDHNVSDPGVTLIETFAYMVDQLIWRVNQVPDRAYVKFLDLLGVRLGAPVAARVPVTFTLSAPQDATVTVPAGTQVATRRDEDEPVVFTTIASAEVPPCAFVAVETDWDDRQIDRTEELRRQRRFSCFQEQPAEGDAFLVGLSVAVPACTVRLDLDCDVRGAGIQPGDPPIVWEAWTVDGWIACDVESDGTGGFNRRGAVVLHVPPGHRARVGAGDRMAAWLRCRVDRRPGQYAYEKSPQITRISAQTIGVTTEAVNAAIVTDEVLGVSDGVPAQSFLVQNRPVVPSSQPSHRIVDILGRDGPHEWHEVESFTLSGPTDPVFVLDGASGTVEFGPMVRERDGTVQRYGAVPPAGATIRLREYRSGGGRRGNVGHDTIAVLKSSVPLIASVTNRVPAIGGVDGEDIESAKHRGPLLIQTRQRAVTAADYEHLAEAATSDVARARCVPAGGPAVAIGAVRVLLVPNVEDDEHGALLPEHRHVAPAVLDTVQAYLERRRLVGVEISVDEMQYAGLSIVARLRVSPGSDPVRVRADALAALYRHFHPVRGGIDGRGWAFGQSATTYEAYSVLQQVPGVERVEDDGVRLFPVDLDLLAREAQRVDRVEAGPHDLVLGWGHQITTV